ncbi:PREDICTED: patellin-3-like [Ipomoea nil]|uniref:patellin-3-like n=1 Tax=Ipomoea nil TaxID=35883 RepID=UPI0009019952|nr:PREDICTED: patellin-3-like [Ipomoea nil]
MAEETKAPAQETPAQEVAPATAPVPEAAAEVVEKEATPEPEPEKTAEEEKEKAAVTESGSFKEESNKVEELPNPEKKALDEFKALVQEALNNHDFTAKPKEEEKKPAAAAAPVAEEQPKPEEDKKESEAAPEPTKEAPVSEEKKDAEAPPKAEEEKKEEVKETEKEIPPPPTEAPSAEPSVVVEKLEEKAATPAEVIKETIVEVAATEEPSTVEPKEEPKTEEVAPPPPPPVPEEVSIWGIPLLADERSDVILLKFLRARDFKVKDAFAMLKSVVAWRKQFKSDDLLEESELGHGLDKVVYMHGVDKEGHPICYNAFAEFQDKELYQSTFADKEKLNNFLRWRIQFMEKSIRNLDFTPEGINTFVQVIDLKNSPGLFFFKKEFRQATNRALQLLQDNYPEFVAKQVFINVPWWYPAYYKMINALFTTRTKSKFVFAGPSKCAETLFKYIAPEQVPVQYGGLSREGDYEFTTGDPATEDTIKPTSKHTIEFPVTEKCTLVWEARVIGWDVAYGSEFVPAAEGAYTIIVEKSRKIGPADETIISNSYKTDCAGKVVLTFDNQTSKRKKLLYRSKTKGSD